VGHFGQGWLLTFWRFKKNFVPVLVMQTTCQVEKVEIETFHLRAFSLSGLIIIE
jgi:hypothetical protein